jgi:hypothetical protein
MDHEGNSTSQTARVAAADEELSFTIVLRPASGPDRIIARAASAQLAHAIFKAAIAEYPDQRLLLSQNGRAIADTGKA